MGDEPTVTAAQSGDRAALAELVRAQYSSLVLPQRVAQRPRPFAIHHPGRRREHDAGQGDRAAVDVPGHGQGHRRLAVRHCPQRDRRPAEAVVRAPHRARLAGLAVGRLRPGGLPRGTVHVRRRRRPNAASSRRCTPAPRCVRRSVASHPGSGRWCGCGTSSASTSRRPPGSSTRHRTRSSRRCCAPSRSSPRCRPCRPRGRR